MSVIASKRSRRLPGLAAITVAAAAVTSLLIGGAPAHAADSPVPVPQAAPPATHIGDALPQFQGTLGQAVYLLMGGSGTGQALEVPNDSGSWGTPARSSQFNGSNAQKWYFQYVGYIDTPTGGYRTYRILHYPASGGVLCLDALGGQAKTFDAVGLYGCDVNGNAQANQLWYAWETAHDGLRIRNVASLTADEAGSNEALVLSTAGQRLSGANSEANLSPFYHYSVNEGNSTWALAKVPSDPSGQRSCSRFECLASLELK